MAIVEGQKVRVKWSSSTKKSLESLGYNYTKMGDELEVSFEHLSENSHAKVMITCDWCNNEKMKRICDIDLNGNHFCSSKCYGQWRSKSEEGRKASDLLKTKIKTKCKVCDSDIDKIPSEFKGHGLHYCSRKCMGKENVYKNGIASTKDKIETKCNHCNRLYKVHESKLKSNTWSFCSRECYSEFRRVHFIGDKVHNYQGITSKCDYCNKEVKITKSYQENTKNTFCSKECYYSYRSKFYSGENHPQFGTKKSPEQIEQMRLNTSKMIAEGRIPQTSTSIQILIRNTLEKLGLSFDEEIPDKYYVLDFYDTKNNLAIEVMGDYWHANPLRYTDYDSLHDIQKKDIKRDKSKKTYFKKNRNLNILYLWERDINNNIDLCEKIIVKYVDTKGTLDNYHSFNYSLIDNKLTLNETIILPYFMRANTKYQKVSDI
ncbi:hypothetical protein [Cytobacillus gottheilii]|uniref:hypothetical protein n=1 Tax=Cytobacillus gottheilii TaxID=859144 RepID=UPI0009BA6727|nr:hypothetical protein [Cytobacillus gottheilii]